VALVVVSSAAADPKRELPDYDGRGNEDADGGSWALWIPRAVLAPLYVVSEYALRRPLGLLVRAAERGRWIENVSEAFTFGPQNDYLLVPTVLFDFGLLPSVGLYFSGDNVFAPGNTVKLHVATWGPRWLDATALDRYTWNAGRSTLSARIDFRRTEDGVYLGTGPDVTRATRSRYGLQRLDGHVSFKHALAAESSLALYAGARAISYREGECCGDPSLTSRIADGSLAMPAGYGTAYTSLYQRAELTLDSRAPRPAPATGVYMSLHGEPNFDVRNGRSWIRYGGVIGGVIDVNSHERAVGLKLGADFVDPLEGGVVPFNELASLGSDLMPGFVDGWMLGRSVIAAQLSYTWPVAVWLDGEARFAAGNAFDERLTGFAPGKLRLCGDVGVTSIGARDQGFEILVGLGTETIEHGEHITSFRLAFGSRRGF